jgi:hypothetical protein
MKTTREKIIVVAANIIVACAVSLNRAG